MTTRAMFRSIDASMTSKNKVKRGIDVSTLKELREKTGMTSFELAVVSEVSLSTLNRMENGKTSVSRRIAYKVINVLSQKLGREIHLEEIDGLRIR